MGIITTIVGHDKYVMLDNTKKLVNMSKSTINQITDDEITQAVAKGTWYIGSFKKIPNMLS